MAEEGEEYVPYCDIKPPERRRTQIDGKPVGDFTGRCRECGSDDLWDDNLHYGCNACGKYLGGGSCL